ESRVFEHGAVGERHGGKENGGGERGARVVHEFAGGIDLGDRIGAGGGGSERAAVGGAQGEHLHAVVRDAAHQRSDGELVRGRVNVGASGGCLVIEEGGGGAGSDRAGAGGLDGGSGGDERGGDLDFVVAVGEGDVGQAGGELRFDVAVGDVAAGNGGTERTVE